MGKAIQIGWFSFLFNAVLPIPPLPEAAQQTVH